VLELRECSARYGSIPVLDAVSLEVGEGRTGCIVGPSGCGKTTLLMLAAGLKQPSAGSVTLDGSPVGAGDRRISLILQGYGLFPWFTAIENVALGLRIRGAPPRQSRKAAAEALERLGLGGRESRYPSALSGGERQRVAIARSLVLSPRLLLMDEPFSALDALTRESLQEFLVETLRGTPLTVLLVTHDVEEAVYLGGTVWLLSQTPGHVVARFDNPGRAGPGRRSDPAFHRVCDEVRQAMRAAKGAGDAS
jgi:NitT/TauT family transport system ATP-binding protein